QRRDADVQGVAAVEEFLPALHGARRKFPAPQEFQQRLAAAGGFGDEQRAAGELREEIQQQPCRFLQAAVEAQLGRLRGTEVVTVADALEGLHLDARMPFDARADLRRREGDLVRLQQWTLNVAVAALVAFLDFRPFAVQRLRSEEHTSELQSREK